MAALVFDLDGTLVDSAPDIMAVANDLLADHGAAPITLADTRSFIGNGIATFIARMRATRGLPAELQDPLLAAFRARYDAAVTRTLPYPGVAHALAVLRHHGHLLGVCTNKPASAARAVLAHTGLLEPFDTIIGGDTLAQQKPDPAPLRAAFATLGSGPRLYIGDSEVDAETAAAAGVPFLLYTQGYRRGPAEAIAAAARFDHHRDLAALITTLAAEVA